jgi:hypothetical protein
MIQGHQVKPYVAAVIPENTFKVPTNDVIIALKFIEENQDLGVLKPILILRR